MSYLPENIAQEMQRHVEEHAAALGVIMTQAVGMPGMMFVEYEPPRIEGPVIREQKDFYVMLHELGHVVHVHTQGRPPHVDQTFYFDNGVLRSECEAWNWALDNSARENSAWENTAWENPTPETAAFMWNVCLGSYYQGALGGLPGKRNRLWNGDRAWVRFEWDEPDEYFMQTFDRIVSFCPDFTLRAIPGIESFRRTREKRRSFAVTS